MKDILGNTLLVGDRILYGQAKHGHISWSERYVIAIGERCIQVQPERTPPTDNRLRSHIFKVDTKCLRLPPAKLPDT